ncbi:MAG: proline racemase family protein [Gemmataceae bacterium]|nr:proline racemase family protein [Gemmataceae bacterium]
MRRVHVIDSHTAGEPTRVVIEGGPDLGTGPLAERRERFGREFDSFRSSVVNEPRGSDVVVGALLVPPADPSCVAGAVFFNNVGTLGMCGHGTIGLAVTLAHLGRIRPGTHRLETPVGVVPFTLGEDNRVSVENVPSYRKFARLRLNDAVVGDLAWGGNWFYILDHGSERLHASNAHDLTEYTNAVRRTLTEDTFGDLDGSAIDHIELTGPPGDPRNHGRNFVLCPGGAYDRSPCGTGTSAKLACLAADGKLSPGEVWRQEGILGTVFEASYRWEDETRRRILPTITGSAYITAEAMLLFDPRDPFREGIRA